jgi:hypothetical protein
MTLIYDTSIINNRIRIFHEGRGVKPKTDHDHVAAWALQTGLPLSQEHIAALAQGYEHLQQLRAMLHRPDPLGTDLAPVFLPEFDR